MQYYHYTSYDDLQLYNRHLVYIQFLQFYTILYFNNYCEFVGPHTVSTLVLHFILLSVILLMARWRSLATETCGCE